jgi:glutaredoxin
VLGLNVKSLLLATGAAAFGFVALGVHAQVYRVVGPDGRVTFTDKAPTLNDNIKVTTVDSALPAGTTNTAGLPFELQQIARKYPVVLYTTSKCSVCASARSFLMQRGIPFAEKTVDTQEEIELFQKQGGDNAMPRLTIGQQVLRAFNEPEWSQYLTAAAYPTSSALPPGYRYANAAPLIPKKESSANQDTPAPVSSSTGTNQTPVAPAPSNPAGIRF